MMQIALALDAYVQGDDGEIYTEEYLVEIEKLRKQQKKPWWKLW